MYAGVAHRKFVVEAFLQDLLQSFVFPLGKLCRNIHPTSLMESDDLLTPCMNGSPLGDNQGATLGVSDMARSDYE